jgi:hypothetical protein
MPIPRAQLVQIVGKRVDISHDGVAENNMLVIDVGERYVFGSRPGNVTDPVIPIDSISKVSWDERTRRELAPKENK